MGAGASSKQVGAGVSLKQVGAGVSLKQVGAGVTMLMSMEMMMNGDSTSPGFLWVLGTRQRTKWGSQLCCDTVVMIFLLTALSYQGCHEFAEGDKVDRGDSLAATLLLLLSFLLGRGRWLKYMVSGISQI